MQLWKVSLQGGIHTLKLYLLIPEDVAKDMKLCSPSGMLDHEVEILCRTAKTQGKWRCIFAGFRATILVPCYLLSDLFFMREKKTFFLFKQLVFIYLFDFCLM